LNSEDGIEIFGRDNTINLTDVRIMDNGEWGLDVSGYNNTITLGGSTMFANNGSGAIVLNGDNNSLYLGGLDIAVVDNGMGNTIV
jgi:hypothetical protein